MDDSSITQVTSHTPHVQLADTLQTTANSNRRPTTPQQYEVWSRSIKLSRGRAPGDPQAQTVVIQCQNIEDLESSLRNFLTGPNSTLSPPEHTTLEFVFPVSAAFLVANPFNIVQPGHQASKANHVSHTLPIPSPFGTPRSTVISVMEAMKPMLDPKDNMKKQRVVARACTEAVQRADGFRYSFQNNWWSKEDEANRFSYYCNDSVLNKGRAANHYASTVGKKVEKPVYECGGGIAVKFSVVQNNLKVQYKHNPLHKTYAERAPPPRPGSKRWKLMELYDPESLPTHRIYNPPKAQPGSEETGQQKRKRNASDPSSVIAPENDLATPGVDSGMTLGTTETGDSSAVSLSTPNPRGRAQASKKPKCTICTAKKSRCDRKLPCDNCFERPSFCTYSPTVANDNATAAEPRLPSSDRQEALPSIDPAHSTGATSKPPPRRRKQKAPARDLQKELGEAMSEFDMLKAKLAEAEKRVKRLESEKQENSRAQSHLPSGIWHIMGVADYAAKNNYSKATGNRE